MNILVDVTKIINNIGIDVETGVFSDIAPDVYVVITPIVDSYVLFASDHPEYDSQEVRISIYSKGSYVDIKNKILTTLQKEPFTITSRQYIGHEDNTGYHHYSIDVAMIYPIEF